MALTFKTAEEMLQHIVNNNDVYNTKTCEYAFLYNDKNAICVYRLSPEQAKELAIESENTHEYWSGLLGAGGTIYDSPDNMHWCEDSYASEYWIHTNNFLEFLNIHEQKETRK